MKTDTQDDRKKGLVGYHFMIYIPDKDFYTSILQIKGSTFAIRWRK